MVGNGYSFAIIRVYQSFGAPDPNGPYTINDAWAGGMSYVDGYIFPCPTCGKSGAQQVAETISFLENNGISLAKSGEPVKNPGNNTSPSVGSVVGMLWADVEGTQYWSSDQNYNVAFIQDMVNEASRQGYNIGIYTNYYQWSPITGNTAQFSYLPLWYAHYDGNPSFSDFFSFGGWSYPNIKQYAGDVNLCGAGVDKNYY
jgi:hypothetical protein